MPSKKPAMEAPSEGVQSASGLVNASTWQEGGTSQTPKEQKLLHVGPLWTLPLYLPLCLAVHL